MPIGGVLLIAGWATLFAAGLIGKRDVPVKLLGTGDADRAYTVQGVSLSASARAKLEAAGFKVKTEDVLPVVNLNKVYSQSIAGGQMAPKGSTIVLKIV
mgnify:CR=1 FL=1